MDIQIIFIFCLCEEFLKQTGFKDDHQCKMSAAEVMTFALTAALFFQGNFRRTRLFFISHKYFSTVLSRSRLNRRIHSIDRDQWMQILCICHYFLQASSSSEYIVDSFPVPVCQNARTWRCRLFSSQKYHGYCASKKTYFWGLKVHMIVNQDGVPIEFFFGPGSEADITAFKRFQLDLLPEGSKIYGDKAYTHYAYEDFLIELGIQLVPRRKRNAKRQHSATQSYILNSKRKRIETVFSCITKEFPRRIHAVTERGFLMKLILFILAFSVKLFMP